MWLENQNLIIWYDTDFGKGSDGGIPRKEMWLNEFSRIQKVDKLTIETYHSMGKY